VRLVVSGSAFTHSAGTGDLAASAKVDDIEVGRVTLVAGDGRPIR
jgi:hypothetical protein